MRGINAELFHDDSPEKRLASFMELLASRRLSFQDIELPSVRCLVHLVRLVRLVRLVHLVRLVRLVGLVRYHKRQQLPNDDVRGRG
jgi:hypothetical protein